MKYNVRGYALSRGLTLHQVFHCAWRDKYGQKPDYDMVRGDIDRYLNFGAVPPYLSHFIESQRTKRPLRTPSYFAYWTAV